MKVLFVVKSKAIETLGVMHLAAVVKQAGHECKIVDLSNPSREFAVKWKPDIVGYSIMTGDIKEFKGFDERLKTRIKFTSLVGGPDPTFFPDGYGWADCIIKGEGEQAMADLLQSGLKYPDINSFPWPDRTDFPDRKIRDFIASRGCLGKCRYCFNSQWMAMFPELSKVRVRKVDDVIKEINYVDPEYVYFQDSCFGVNTKWLREFSEKYRKQINIPFQCHLRPNQVTEERVLLLGDAGCMSVRIALESASSRVRTFIGRGKMDISEVRQAVRLLKKWGINVMLQNMIGLPDSDIEDDMETLEFNIRVKPTYGWVSIFQPYPGTELGKWCKEEGWYKGDFSEIGDSFFDKSVLSFDDEHKEQLACLQKIFAMCVEIGYMPQIKELTYENFPKLVHKVMRWLGDQRLYGGVI